MPKAQKFKRGNAPGPQSTPYAKDTSSGQKNALFKMNTNVGQHVLKNPGIAQAIVDKSNIRQSDAVLEIGPGTGNLTVKILAVAKHVHAIELDPRMAAELTKRVQSNPSMSKRLNIYLGDAIKMDFKKDIPSFDCLISNTPYVISSPLVTKLLSMEHPPRVSVLMFQKEFSARLLAKPGDKLYSRLSVNTQLYAKVTHVMEVGRNNFNPPPKVSSSVVRITPRIPRPNIAYAEFDGMLRILFSRKNKTTRSSFIGTSSVMDMLTSNYKTWAAQNGIVLDDGPCDPSDDAEDDSMAVDDEWDGIMDVDEEDMDELPTFLKEEMARKANEKNKGGKRKKRGKVAELVREKVRKVLEDDTELADQRARMCDEGDFLKLLYAFNQEGIHFS